MSIHRKLMTGCAVAVLAFGLAACGSSDDDDTPTAMMPMGTPVAFADLEMGQTVEAGTYAVSDPSVAFLAATEDFELPEGGYAPGAMESVGGLDFTCAADSATNCNVVVNEDGSITTTGTIQVAMTPPPPTPIESATMAAVTAASEAATAAQTAADDAKTAYEAAATAAENRAWFQTMPRSSESRDTAKEAAMAAATSAADAKTAAEDAAAAEDVTAAIEARIKAETAQADAEVAKQDAEDARDEAQARALVELKIVGKTKSVGDKSITVGTEMITKTVGTVTRTYGLINQRDDTGGGSLGAAVTAPVAADPGNNIVAAPEFPGRPSVANAPVKIAEIFDSTDDDARLTLVTQYLGHRAVNAFASMGETAITGSTATTINHDADVDTDEVMVRPASGTFLRTQNVDATQDAAPDAPITFTAAVDGADAEGHTLRSGIKSTQLSYYSTGEADDSATKTRDESKQYVYLSMINNTTSTYTYDMVEVVSGVRIPEEKEFAHLHYGLWADLKADGNTLNDRGIAFVTGIPDGGGLTQDMPAFGDATYAGNWVANIKAADVNGEGAVVSSWGGASMTADFAEGDVGVTLNRLASFEASMVEGSSNRFFTREVEVNAGTNAEFGLNPNANFGAYRLE